MHADCLRASSSRSLDQQANRTRDTRSSLSLQRIAVVWMCAIISCRLPPPPTTIGNVVLSLSSLQQLISTRILITYTYESDRNQLIICTDADQLFIAVRTRRRREKKESRSFVPSCLFAIDYSDQSHLCVRECIMH